LYFIKDMKLLKKLISYFFALLFTNLILMIPYFSILINMESRSISDLDDFFTLFIFYFFTFVMPFFLIFTFIKFLLKFLHKKLYHVFISSASVFLIGIILMFISNKQNCSHYGYSLNDLLCCLYPEYILVTLFGIINYYIFTKIFLKH
jgi:hypothetical protein